jgi:predicted acetyltransferase
VEIVNPVPVDELEPWFTTMIVTYLGNPAEFAAELPSRAATWIPQRTWGARADGRWVATLRTMPQLLTVPGTDEPVSADALTNVSVSATHRRRGLLTAMINDSLAAAKERQDPLSILISAEWPIYGRYGYAPASDVASYTVHTRVPGARLNHGTTGRVRQVESAELQQVAPAVFDTVRRARAGNIDRSPQWWERHLRPAPSATKPTPVHVVHETNAGVDGYLSWIPTGEWELTGRLGQVTVTDFMAANGPAYIDLWHYLLGIDAVDQVHLRERPLDEPLQWLLADGRAIRQTNRIDRMWVRLLDVPAALSARRYPVADALVLEVVDDDGAGYASGRYLLEGGLDGASCAPTRREPDLRLGQRALAAAYLGGVGLREQAIAGQVEELSARALRRIDAMFGGAHAPWCATGF